MDEIKQFRTKTAELSWTIPQDYPNAGTVGHHNRDSGPQTGSTTLHNELRRITDESLTLDEFNEAVTKLAEKWKIQPGLPTLPKSN